MGSDQFFEKPADPADSDLDLTDEPVEEPSGTPIETIPFDDAGTITDAVPETVLIDEGNSPEATADASADAEAAV